MLPFLKRKDGAASTGLIIKERQPDVSEDQDDPSAAHEACGQAILQAIQSGDASGLASAIKDLMELDDSSDIEPHSYDAQNQLAAKGEG